MKRPLCRSLAAIALVLGGAARGADLDLKGTEEPPGGDWTGFYFGAHLGYATGVSHWATAGGAAAAPTMGSLDLSRPFNAFDGSGSQFGGLMAGYNRELPSRFVVGVEADVSFPSTFSANEDFVSPFAGAGNYSDVVEMFGGVRGRFGYDASHWLYYMTGGLAWSYEQLDRTAAGASMRIAPGTIEALFLGRIGWSIGGGVEVPVAPGWSVRAEYLYSQFGNGSATFPLSGQAFTSDLSTQQVRFGLNYQLGVDPKASGLPFGIVPLVTDDWAVHAQSTYVSQYAPPFRAPYSGPNSLASNSGRETWDATLYVGRRLWQGAELWVDPEIDQGFGLSDTLGVAGFTSGEAYKVGASYPYLRLPRTFVRQTIDLGGPSQTVENDNNQFAGPQTADRLVITAGKFSVSDIFDTIRYSHDPRNDFLNWSLIDAGTFDYAADAWGFTYGASVEWYQGNWALRVGLFDLSVVPNSVKLDPTFEQLQFVYELEHRHELWGQPGKIAVDGFLSRGRMGRFDDAIALAQQTGTLPDTATVRRYTSRPGVNLNIEQQIVPDVGVFGRVGWANGNVEPYEFTDIDRTASIGLSLGGKLWGRPEDTFGLATVFNGISSMHIAYLNDGGLGILVGDGQLPHPGMERIVETYYRFPLANWQVTGDYQFIANPAYNRDRGPVSVITARLRIQI